MNPIREVIDNTVNLNSHYKERFLRLENSHPLLANLPRSRGDD